MSNFYVIKGLGPLFDGLVVEAANIDSVTKDIEVSSIIDRDSIMGDRNPRFQLPQAALKICSDYLEPTDDPGKREFAADNPYGRFLLEGRMEVDQIVVSYSQYERVLQVNVFDERAQRTLYSQNFTKDFDLVKKAIESVLKDEETTTDDLVFALQELKEAESNG